MARKKRIASGQRHRGLFAEQLEVRAAEALARGRDLGEVHVVVDADLPERHAEKVLAGVYLAAMSKTTTTPRLIA